MILNIDYYESLLKIVNHFNNRKFDDYSSRHL